MTKNRTRRSQGFMIVEMVMAFALLLILGGAFFAVWSTVQRMDRTFTVERQGLMVVDNTTERLEALPVRTADDVKRIFLDEFSKSGIPPQAAITPEVQDQDGNILLNLRRANGKSLIEVKINAKK